MLTIVIAIIAILFSYYSVISKKPRIFLKIVPAFKDNFGVHLNLQVSNAGDKPAFDVKLTLKDHPEIFIHDIFYSASQEKKIEENIMINKQLDLFKNKKIEELTEVEKFNLRNLLGNGKDNYYLRRGRTKQNLEKCFGHIINFISSGDSETLFMGISKNSSDFLKEKFKMNVNISFYEELKIDFFSKQILKLIFNILDRISILMIIMHSLLICLLYFLNIYPINIYFNINYKEKIIKTLLNNNIKIDIKNSRVIINYNYEYFVEFDINYPVKASYSNIEKKIDVLCEHLENEKKYLFFNSQIYKNWELSLTKDEMKIILHYKNIYGHYYDKYINLYGLMYEDNCDEMIKNKKGFKEKYKKLIMLIYDSGLLSTEQRKSIQYFNAVYKDKGVL